MAQRHGDEARSVHNRSYEADASLERRFCRLDVHHEIDYITQRAQAEDVRVVSLGNLVLFSTGTADAWLLDSEDGMALCLCRGGEPQPIRIIETPESLAIEWTARFAIQGARFIVHERSGKLVTIQGYPTTEIAAACGR